MMSNTADRFCDCATSGLDVVVARIGANVEVNTDGAEAIAHLVIHAEDALNVHVRLKRGPDRMQLYAASLRDRGNARREAARKTGENEFDRSRSIVIWPQRPAGGLPRP